jgi:hypothetical protein
VPIIKNPVIIKQLGIAIVIPFSLVAIILAEDRAYIYEI